MSKNKKESMDLKNLEVDPFDEFEEFEEYDDDLTIETERDFFDEFDQSDLESVPEYDSKSGKIIEGSEPISKAENKDNKVDEDNIALMKTIDEVDVSNVKNADKPINLEEVTLSLETKKVTKSKTSKPKKLTKKSANEKTLKDGTKIIDNVKVDSDGVPLLNQFDTEKIKESSLLPKITISKVSMTKIVMIVLGVIVALVGVFQAMNDVVRVSDHVMYGEHESIAFGLIILGIIIIILAFYKEIMKIAGLNNITNVMDDIDSYDDKESKRKK